jgi:hypothetical protein
VSALTFDPGAHVYTLDTRPVRSVTELLRTVGLIDFSGIPPSILQAAQHRGTTVHAAVHYYNEHDLDVDQFAREFPGYAGYLQSWIALMDTGRLETVLCEHRVARRTPWFAGTLDWLGLFDGHAAILDFATGRPEDVAKHLQTAGYVLAAAEWKSEPGEAALEDFLSRHPFVERYSVQLNKHGTLPTPHPYRDPRDFAVFRLIAETVGAVDRERARAVQWAWDRE